MSTAPPHDPAPPAAAAGRPLRILVVTPEPPRPDRSAADRRIREILRFLADAPHRVRLHWLERGFQALEHHDRYIDAVRGLGVACDRDYRRLSTTLAADVFDLVYVEYWFAAEKILPAVRTRQPWAPVIIDTVDVHFAREEAELVYAEPPGGPEGVAARKRRELAAYRAADHVVAVTDDDRANLEPYAPLPPVHTVPLVVPLRPRPAQAREPRLMFIGGYDHHPNRDAVTWFAREIWPAVRAAVPDARLDVIGNRPKPEVLALGQLPGIEVLGYVPATEPYLDRSAALVAPLRFGAGMKGKVAEALASAVPVVTTSVGAQGFGAVPGVHLRLADDPAAFAAAVIDVLQDPAAAERMGRAGQDLLATRCTPQVVDRQLGQLIDRAARGLRTPRTAPPGLILRRGLDRARSAAGYARRLVLRRPAPSLAGPESSPP